MKKKLGEICKCINGVTYKPKNVVFKDDENAVPLLRANNIFDNKINYENLVYIDKNCISESQLLQQGDVLLCASSGSKNLVGKAASIEIDINSTFGAFCKVIRPINVSSKLLSHYFASNNYRRNISALAEGVNIKNIKNSHLHTLEIDVFSSEKENKIIEILDKITILIQNRKKQLLKLDELAKSQFIEMFGDPITNPKGWKIEKLENIAPVKQYKGNFEEKVWLLNLDMIESHTGAIIEFVYIPKNKIVNSVCSFSEENILYSKLRPYLNKVVIPNKKGFATSELLPLRPKENLNRIFLAHLLRSNEFVSYIKIKVSGAKMPRVVIADLKNFECILPPLILQNEFSDFIQQLDKSKFRIKQSLEKLETLYKALLQEYFG